MRIYGDLAPWFHLLTAPTDYVVEAERYRTLILEEVPDARTLLELGSGGGNNASHLKAHFACTLADVSPQMLTLSRDLNPDCEHVLGDMRTLPRKNVRRRFRPRRRHVPDGRGRPARLHGDCRSPTPTRRCGPLRPRRHPRDVRARHRPRRARRRRRRVRCATSSGRTRPTPAARRSRSTTSSCSSSRGKNRASCTTATRTGSFPSTPGSTCSRVQDSPRDSCLVDPADEDAPDDVSRPPA